MQVQLKKFIKPIAIVGVVAAIGLLAYRSISNKAAIAAAAMIQGPRTVTLEKGDLANVVSVTGTVFSETATNVYSTVGAQVKVVHVKVGDTVQEGDLLAELDSSDLERSLASSQATLSSSQASALLNLELAQKDLATYKKNLNDDTNTTLLQAKDRLDNAELAVAEADMRVDNAMTAVSRRRKEFNDWRDNGYTKDDDEYIKARQLHEDAQSTLALANAALEQAKVVRDQAETTYEALLANNKTTTESSIESYQDRVRSAELGIDFTPQVLAIQKTKEDIANCEVTAPVSGTITAVHAVEGGSGSGLLFVIQDTDNLKIITNIKEYDIGVVSVGDAVTIKSDALSGAVFEGVLAKIAPTSTIAAGGATAVSSDSEYQSEIRVVGEKEGLRIGMNTRLSIITDERRDIYSVPYEAVGQNENGDTVIYVMDTAEDGTVSTREIAVTVGMENDLFSEISSPELADGMSVYRDSAQGLMALTGGPTAGGGAEGPQGGPPDGVRMGG